MGIFSGIGSAISSAVNSVCSYISSGVSSIGGAIGSFAKSIIAPFPEIAMAETVLRVIVAVVSFVAEALGITEKEETPEEFGAKAMQSEKSPEEFESTEAYIEYLRNEVELDKEKFEKMSPEQKLGCTAVGVSILIKGIEEKERVSIPVEFLHEIGKVNMKSEEVKSYIESFKTNGLTDMGELSSYLKGNLQENKVDSVDSAIVQALKNLNPDLGDSDIQGKIIEMKQESRKEEGM